MFRWAYRVGLLFGAFLLALFIGAKLVHLFDPYRIVTEDLIQQVAVQPQRTVRLHAYGTLAGQFRQTLYTEQAAAFAGWLDRTNLAGLLNWVPLGTPVRLAVGGVDTAVHKIADLDDELEAIAEAESLSRDLAGLRFYDLANGDVILADLYQQSTAVSGSLSEVSSGLGEVASAISAVTTLPTLEAIQQELLDVRHTATSVAAGDGGLASLVLPLETANEFAQLANFIHGSIESWQGVPDNLMTTKEQLDADVAWLGNFQQQYTQARAFNDRWHFNALRLLPRFVALNYRPLLLGIIGNLLMALAGWLGSRERQPVSHSGPHRVGTHSARPAQLRPRLAFLWPDGRCDYQSLPDTGELAIGNVVIRRARVRYYLDRLDNAFPTLLNGHSICGARILNDGDVLQIGELKTIFRKAD